MASAVDNSAGTASVALKVGMWMAVSAACFAVLVGIVRFLSAEMDVFVISFWRNCFAVLIFLPWLVRVGPAALKTRRIGTYLVRSTFMVVSSTLLFFSVVLMPIGEATALSFTTPLFTTILAVLVLRETVGLRRWSALVIGFAGVLIMLRPGVAAFEPAAILVILSAISFAAVVVIAKMLAATESPELIVVYLSLFSIPLSLVPALFYWQWPNGEQFLWLVALGAMASGNMYGISRALQIGDASLSQPFDFFRLPMTALVGYFYFQEVLDIWVWVGAAVIFASAAYVTHREALKRRRPTA